MSRLDTTFTGLRRRGETGLVAYVTAGDPDIERTGEILSSLDQAGASIIELGVPFSDPVADGPVIQRAAQRAVSRGASLRTALDLVSRVRPSLRAPLVLFTYANPILRLGAGSFASMAADAGVDGVLVVDMPVEESAAFHDRALAAGLDRIYLVSPTTGPDRVRKMAALGSGFLYAISRLGVTGASDAINGDAREVVRRIREESRLPVAVGFGISRPDHVRQVGCWAEAAVVGSSLVRVIEQESERGGDVAKAAARHVEWLLSGVGTESSLVLPATPGTE
jgi:tryptophan synthase alpha chain